MRQFWMAVAALGAYACLLVWAAVSGRAQQPMPAVAPLTPSIRMVSTPLGCTIYAPSEAVETRVNKMSHEAIITITYPVPPSK